MHPNELAGHAVLAYGLLPTGDQRCVVDGEGVVGVDV